MAAFFDVDNTLLRGASTYWFARGLAARDHLRARDLLRFGARQLRFRLVAREHHGHIAAARQSALAFVAGWRVAELRALAEEIYDELIAPRVWAGTRALAERHLAAGEPVWLVTAAPVELAEVVAGRLGFTGGLGTIAEVADGAYTGALRGELLHGQAKADAVTKLAATEGIDLSRCSAYSDSINDLPLLTTVGHPAAVNPDTALRRHARRHGWPVHDFRQVRRAARFGVPAALAGGAVGGAVAAAAVLRRRRRRFPGPSGSQSGGAPARMRRS